MVNVLLGPVIMKLTELLIEELKSLNGVHKEVESLRDELEIIQPLLRDVEAKFEREETSDTVKAWVNQIQVQANRIEDLVDEYRYHLREVRHKKGFSAYLRKSSRIVTSLKPRHEISSEVKSIKKSLHDIRERGKGYGLRPLDLVGPSKCSAGGEHVDPRLESLFVEDRDIVGIDSVKDELTNKLLKGPSELLVISLVGQGGVGKTTLAKKVFDYGVVVQHFELVRTWITVSQPYDLKKILKTLMRELCAGQDAVTIEDLIKCVRNYLRTKRYAIVFDDVWEEKFWDDIKLALPINNEGSRILITTRNGAIANHCKKSPYDFTRNIRPWSITPALDLFCRKAFHYEFQGVCPDELLQLSTEIVSKCQGLPLVVAAIAGILATKEKTVFEWKRMLSDLNSKVRMSSEVTRVHKILSLSYNDLPNSLRPCFMYICLFPEDYVISDERLYRLWIAEGFVKGKGDKTLEEVAEEYMSDLIRRNLVLLDRSQVIGEGNYFRVHDLMRDVILLRAEELNFSQIWDEKTSKFIGHGRRLMINGNAKNAKEKIETSRARSIFLSSTDNNQLTESFMATFFQKLKLLEVLNVENLQIDSLPKELGRMLSLKYLSIRKSNVKSLPKSINKLQNLYSLDIRDTLITELPKEINELRNLQHILAYRYNQNYKSDFEYVIGVRLHQGLRGLEGLQTLTDVDLNSGGVAIIEELEKLDKLRWLDIMGLTAELGAALCTTIGKLNRLQRLSIDSVAETEPLALQHIPSPPLELQELTLLGRLERFPDWISKLQSLRLLALSSSRLIGTELIDSLKDLPELEILQIGADAYVGEELHFEEGGFRRLKTLRLYVLENLRVVMIDTGALLALEHIGIHNCWHLEQVSSLQHLRNVNFAFANGQLIV